MGLPVQDVGAAAVFLVGGGDQTTFHAGGVGDQIDGDVVFEQLDVGVFPDLLQQGPLHLPAGHILGVDDPVAGMSPFTAQIEGFRRSVGAPAEGNPPLDQFRDARRPFLDHQAHHLGMTEAGARCQGVLDVEIEGIAAVEDRSDTALGMVGIALHGLFFGDQGHPADLGGIKGKQKTGNPTADNQEIGLMCFHWKSRPSVRGIRYAGCNALGTEPPLRRRRRPGASDLDHIHGFTPLALHDQTQQNPDKQDAPAAKEKDQILAHLKRAGIR